MNSGRTTLLAAGIASPLVYIGTDILAGNLYRGYSFRGQAVSELFAIGAPTSALAVAGFTLSSLLLACFAIGVWSSHRRRAVRGIAVLMLANAADSLLLWNLFPMHMRGAEPTFTDTMHGLLAINPFVLLTIVFGAAAFRHWFRWYSIATILFVFLTAAVAFMDAASVVANQPTPLLGVTERLAQYAHQTWHAVLAFVLLREAPSGEPQLFAMMAQVKGRVEQ